MTTATTPAAPLLDRPRPAHRPKVGLVAGGLGTYWPQFPALLPQLQACARRVAQRLGELGAEVVDAGFVSDAHEGSRAADMLQAAACDIILLYAPTYLTASMVAPIAQRCGAPILVLNLQPEKVMDHARFDTGSWLAYCGGCPVPEISNSFARLGVAFRSVSGYLEEDRAWEKIARWVRVAGVSGSMRTARHGLLGHLYPGMLDVSTDLTMVTSQFGGHVEVLEIDDLRVRVEAVTDGETEQRVELAKEIFDLDTSVRPEDLAWGARVSVGLDRLVEDFSLDSLAYYHRGLGADLHERVAAGMILGASLLTARGIPAVGEYELRTSLAMLVMDRLGAGGSFTEIQALNFEDDVVEMGHDGPAHLAISSGRPLLRGLGVYHGKAGFGVSVEFDVTHGPVTLLGVTQTVDGRYRLVTSEGTVVPGPLLRIGNTTSRVDFGGHPGDWLDAFSATGMSHHWALGVGSRAADLRVFAELHGLDLVEVSLPAGSRTR